MSSRTKALLLFFSTTITSCRIRSLFFSRKPLKQHTRLSQKCQTANRYLVLDFSRIVCYDERILPLVGYFVVLVRFQERVKLVQHRLVGAVVDIALFINEPKQAIWFALNRKIVTFFMAATEPGIVARTRCCPCTRCSSMQCLLSDTLPEIVAFLRPMVTKACLFELEDVLVEVGLQVFIGVVNA